MMSNSQLLLLKKDVCTASFQNFQDIAFLEIFKGRLRYSCETYEDIIFIAFQESLLEKQEAEPIGPPRQQPEDLLQGLQETEKKFT